MHDAQNAQSKALIFRHEHTLALPCLVSMLITSATAHCGTALNKRRSRAARHSPLLLRFLCGCRK
nr:MAG TPA: hypothetical protein [Caudoviricetes sp.]